jgi:hypothetical protein
MMEGELRAEPCKCMEESLRWVERRMAKPSEESGRGEDGSLHHVSSGTEV